MQGSESSLPGRRPRTERANYALAMTIVLVILSVRLWNRAIVAVILVSASLEFGTKLHDPMAAALAALAAMPCHRRPPTVADVPVQTGHSLGLVFGMRPD